MNKHNLKEVTLKIPLGQLIAVAGVSGSGKSTAIRRVLFPIIKELLFLRRELSKAKIKKIVRNNGATAIGGWEKIQEIVDVGDFKCFVGKRSIVATASGILGPLRELFARTVEARMLGYTARSFLFTESGSCCERCLGSGELVFVAGRGELAAKCMQCLGSRYNSRILQIKYKNNSIADVLSMTVAECREHFGRVPRIRHILHRLESFGLGYLKLSQHTKTLSHGEQQRLRLCMNFSERVGKHVLYLFDEPTRGLQSTEIEQLYRVLRRLVKGNNSVIVIEHNPEIIAAADYIVEFGAGAGRSGGSIIAEGIPAEIRVNSNSLIGEYLQSVE